MDRERCQLLLIDIQERLAPHVTDCDAVVANCIRLAHYAAALGVPASLVEHYTKGLGRTAPAIVSAAGNETPIFEKITFSSWADAAIRGRVEALRENGRDQVVIAGMEAHVCVCQTSLDLLNAGYEVYLVGDAVGSRAAQVRDFAIRRLERAGAHIVTHEMVAFEWLGRGDTKEFKDVIEVIK